MQHAANVDVNHSVPLIDFERFELRERHDSSVVDENVDAAMQFDSEVNEGLHVIQVGDIQRLYISGTAC
ncbi:hypothetical protein D3C79_932930 [compost metagenome]